jgi:hypothetical protein
MTPEEFLDLVLAQDGRCRICKTDQPGGYGNQWHIDHDHETGVVRGLLCSTCNTKLGWYEPRAWQIQNYLTSGGVTR